MARRLFDNLLESGFAGRRTKKRAISLPVSIGIHVAVLSAVILIPILMSGRELPEPALGAVSAFFVEPAPPPPPPPPPPPAAAKPKEATPPKVVEKPKVVPVEEPKFTAPVETPKEVPKTQVADFGVESGVDEGVTGGVQGGTVGGVEGGTVGGVHGGTLGGTPGGGMGGIGDAPPPPAPPPPPKVVEPPKGPVRVGGKISEPKKTHNVAPTYPEMAKRARVQGTVILEATISPQGRVTDVKVLRGIPMLDEAAMSAVRQWTYSPTLLNGSPVPVIMSVTVNFKLDGSGGMDTSVQRAAKPTKDEPKAAKAEPAAPAQQPPPAAAPAAPAPAAPAPPAAPAAEPPAPAAPPPAQAPAEQPAPEPTPPPGG
jgi:periplasmic protein TonB